MADTGSTPTAPEAAPAAPAASPAAEGGDLSLADIVAEAVAEAEKEGRSLTPPEDAPPTGEKPPEPAAAKPEEPAPATEEPPVEPEPTNAEARRMLAAAERKLAEAHQVVERATADLLAGLAKNPKATLAKLGTTLDALIDASLDEGDAPAPAAKPQAESELEKRIRAIEEREQKLQLDSKIAEVHRQVTADTKRFPTIVAKGQQELVTKYMVAHWQKHGAPIAWDKAAARVETELRALTGGVPAPRPAAVPAAAPAARPGTQTLKNDEVRTAPPAADDDPTVGMDPERALRWLVEHGP